MLFVIWICRVYSSSGSSTTHDTVYAGHKTARQQQHSIEGCPSILSFFVGSFSQFCHALLELWYIVGQANLAALSANHFPCG